MGQVLGSGSHYRGGPAGDSRANGTLVSYDVLGPEANGSGRRRRHRVEHSQLPKERAGGYEYPSRKSYVFLGAGPWRVELRDRKGRRFVWKAGLTYNQAQQAAKRARAAHYRDPRIAKRGAR